MTLLSEEVLSYVGMESPLVEAPEPVEAGAVRRYAQAIMDEDSAYFQALDGERPIAPPLFPTHMFRRGFGEPDVVSERAGDPDYDGAIASSSRGLPDLPLPNMVRLNGGVEVEFFRYARHGERVVMKSRYAEIVEREGSKGPMVLAKVDTDYLTGDGALLLRVRNTGIYRTAS